MRPTTFAEVFRERASLEEQLSKEKQRHNEVISLLGSRIERCKESERMLTESIDVGAVAKAEEVISVLGYMGDVPERISVVKDACMDLARGAEKLKKGFLGVKDYGHFRDQRCDCGYGYGPTHGNIVFSVALVKEARCRTLRSEEIESAIYYLTQLKAIQSTCCAGSFHVMHQQELPKALWLLEGEIRDLVFPVPAEPPDPVARANDGYWYFWDETWTGCCGPFDGEEAARNACRTYAQSL